MKLISTGSRDLASVLRRAGSVMGSVLPGPAERHDFNRLSERFRSMFTLCHLRREIRAD